MTVDVLDVLIVGGGPAGTAAAFRSKELGIEALVIEIALAGEHGYPEDQ